MTALITLADIQALESISENIDFDTKVRPHIFDAQEFDVRPLVGEELWIDIIENPANYTEVLDEFTYTHQGHKYQHPGLKKVIVMYAVSRYKAVLPETDTAYGLVMKNNEHSTHVSDKRIARAEAKAKAGAEIYWSRVRDFLCRKSSDFPLWKGAKTKLTGNGLRFKKASIY